MRIDGLPLLLTAAFLVLASAAAIATRWHRVGPIPRTMLVLVSVIGVTATAALQLNRMTATYGGADAVTAPTVAAGTGGRLVETTIAGRASGMTMPAWVYLPPGYADGHQRYPVVEAFHGFPGSPKGWLRKLNAVGYLDREIAAGRMAPTVVAFVYQTPDPLIDTECTDLTGGPRAETYLTVDVPAAIKTRFRVRTDRAAWGLIGYSAGGFCAADLLLRHPDRYAAGAALSGYATPGITVGDGSERTTNNIAWRLRHLARPVVSLYLAYAGDDAHSRRDTLLMARLATAPMSVTTAVVAHGGHSNAVWRTTQPPAYDWLSARLARPVAVP
ncbi:alpha/beta hydrolase-fold protein [Actinoplanes sp. NPDC089786]|uniref:alpha/beta hydrolase n=1 Tax=Actinoplanes sp. NPDC089786 TaxID=3155185 RepID=UPI00344967E3